VRSGAKLFLIALPMLTTAVAIAPRIQAKTGDADDSIRQFLAQTSAAANVHIWYSSGKS